MRKPVYITRDTESSNVEVWRTNPGIMKVKGCVQYFSGAAVANGNIDGETAFKGRIEAVNPDVCEKKFGSTPEPGAAYYVEEKATMWAWTRIDDNMNLLDRETLEVLE